MPVIVMGIVLISLFSMGLILIMVMLSKKEIMLIKLLIRLLIFIIIATRIQIKTKTPKITLHRKFAFIPTNPKIRHPCITKTTNITKY